MITGTIANLYTVSVCLVYVCHHLGMSRDGIRPKSLCANSVVVAQDMLRLYHVHINVFHTFLVTVGLETDGSIRLNSLLCDVLRVIPDLHIHGKVTAFNKLLEAVGEMDPVGLLVVLRDVLCDLDVRGKVRFVNTVVSILTMMRFYRTPCVR